jgi:hypothetical protein
MLADPPAHATPRTHGVPLPPPSPQDDAINPFPLNSIILIYEYGTHQVTLVVIRSRYPRPTSPSRHHDKNPVTVTLLGSHRYKYPLLQPLSFDILTNSRGYGGPSAFSRHFDVMTFRHSDDFLLRVFNRSLTHSIQVPYPVNPLLATLTKTAGCTPTIPALELWSPSHFPDGTS